MNELQKAIERITYEDKKFPQEALEVIIANKEEAIPYLRNAVEKAMEEKYELEEGYQLHFYAIYLLGEFQDREFFPKLIELASLPGDELDYLIGDAVTEGLRDILYSTYNGNMELLKNAALNSHIDEYVRSGLIDVMGQLYLDGSLDEKAWKTFIAEGVHSGQEYSYFYAGLADAICQCHFAEMLPEIRYMLDNDLLDEIAMGKYDSCVDCMFEYGKYDDRFCKSPVNTINMLKHWAMFQDGSSEKEGQERLRELKKSLLLESRKSSDPKVGRNDPCPCGSGKKYKFCCMNKPASPLDSIESALGRDKVLQRYPYTGEDRQEGRIYLRDYFDSESIEIDKILYLGLMERPGYIWLRDEEKEEKRCQGYLSLAFEMFIEKAEKENIQNFEEYDQRFSIHYFCEEWMGELLRLSKKERNDELYRRVNKYFQEMRNMSGS